MKTRLRRSRIRSRHYLTKPKIWIWTKTLRSEEDRIGKKTLQEDEINQKNFLYKKQDWESEEEESSISLLKLKKKKRSEEGLTKKKKWDLYKGFTEKKEMERV